MKKLCVISILIITSLFTYCKKHGNNTAPLNIGKVAIKIAYKVDVSPLIFDTIKYYNAADNDFSVEKLQYYISKIRLYKAGKVCYSGNDAIYCDARRDGISAFSFTPPQGLEPGTYDSITFYIGIDSAQNITNGLPQTLDNIGMGWPDAMGGGYHFLKLEGHWNNNGAISGYAIHIGQNGFQVHATVPYLFTVPATGDVNLNITMNVNEWFRNPSVYDLKLDGVFTMGDTLLMKKLCTNGTDVFYCY